MTKRKFAAGAAGLALIAAGGTAALGATSAAVPDTAVVKQKFSLKMVPNRYVQDGMRFNKDTYTVKAGGTLKVVLTKPQEGPHTVTLVKRGDLPTTAQEAFEGCKVCEKLGKAHGADPNSDAPPKFPFLENGKGQDTPPKFDRPGDSGVTGPKKGNSFSGKVTAKAGTTRYFMCLIHPWMQAKLAVK
jgi:plastocyanin